MRKLMLSCVLACSFFALPVLFLFTPVSTALAADLPAVPPNGWWWYYGQTPAQISSLLAANNARLVSIQVEQTSPLLFTVAMVQNTGAYAKTWWWYYGQTQADLSNQLQAHNARLINLDAYEVNGTTYFAAILISNTGADAAGWWWYFGQTPSEISSLLKQNNARLLDLRQYSANGGTTYAAVMIQNTGTFAESWWWYYNVSAAQISSTLQQNNAYLVSLQIANESGPTFNVVMEQLPAPGGRGWWWYYDLGPAELNNLVTLNQAWIRDIKTYQLNGQRVFTALMLGGYPDYNVSTQHNNAFRNGAYLVESTLTPTNVQSGFGLLYSREVNGAIYAQPLYVHGVKTSAGSKNLFFIATETNWVYAFDADDSSASAGPIFSRQLQPTGPSSVCGETPSGVVGITGTPVIDEGANVMYVVARNANDQNHYLHKLDITNKFKDLANPVAIGGTDPSGVPFNGKCERQRPGLLLNNNGVVYAGFGTFSCDAPCSNSVPYHGWILGYKASDLSPAAIFCTSCANSGSQAGVWQTGGGLVSDGANIYFETGNGGPPLGDSFVKLQITNSWPGLALAGSYTPVNASTLAGGDTDLGSGGPVLIAPRSLVGGGKQGRYYVINTPNMQLAQDPAPAGGFDGFQAFTNTYHNDPGKPACSAAPGATGCNAQPGTTCYVPPSDYGNGEICGPNIHGTPVSWQYANSGFGYVYEMPEKDYVKAFHYDNATKHLQEPAALTGADRPPDGMPGGFSSLSANWGANGILWTSWPLGDAQWNYAPGRLAAFDALSLKELWHDDGGYMFAKSVPPTIAEGKVFRATGSGRVLVYGLLPKINQARSLEVAAVTGVQALQETHKRFGAEHGVLGTAVGDAKPLDDGGWFQDFKSNLPLHGFSVVSVHPNHAAMDISCAHPPPATAYTQVDSSVYWSPGTGAHVVSGEIRQFWLSQGGPKGPLGLPVSDEMPAPDGLGRVSQFEHGEITWHFDTGASVTQMMR